MSTTIQPVLRNFPISHDILDASNLPFAITISPLLQSTEDSDDTNIERHDTLTGIPKCLHCGAPHACTNTNFWKINTDNNSKTLLCFLCCKTSEFPLNIENNSSNNNNNSSTADISKKTGNSNSNSNKKIQLFGLPLRVASRNNTNHTNNNNQYELPAIQCPVLWYIVLDGSNTSNRNYWFHISKSLQEIIKTAPDYIHIAILIASQNDTTTYENTTNNNENINDTNIGNNNNNNNINNERFLSIFDLHSAVPHVHTYSSDSAASRQEDLLQAVIFAPSNTPHIPAALRSLMDYNSFNTDETSTYKCPIAWTTEVILAALQQYAIPAGQRGGHHTNQNTNNNENDYLLPYAGVKITYLLTQRPAGISQTSKRWNMDNSTSKLPELTQEYLQDRYQPPRGLEEYYSELGKQCADSAVGVDLILLYEDDNDNTMPDFGLPYYQSLSDRSGAPGPVLIEYSNNSKDNALDTELKSRAPWKACYGAELRIRLSPGYAVDPNLIDDTANPLVPNEGGLFGPASSVGESAQLWRMGCTDSFATFTLDLEIEKNLQDRYFVPGLGEVALKPVIQTCFAYTTIIQDPDTKQYKTVRQMRIASRPVPLVRSVEALYASVDTEALAVVLFHKMSIAIYQDGNKEADEMARNWLQLLLSCVYRSAQEQLQVQRQFDESGVELNSRSGIDDRVNQYFYPNERLLDLEGELSQEDVLLAAGHERLRPIPLMVYLLLQAVRPSPSLDIWCAMLNQMHSMGPSTLTRCIAPRLQLWESGKTIQEPIVEVLELRSDAVQSAVLEYNGTAGLILFLDTPSEIVLMDARYINTDLSDVSPSRKKKVIKRLIVGDALQRAVDDAANSYRTKPKITYELDQSDTCGEQTFLRLVDCLIEDTSRGEYHNFTDWKTDFAHQVEDDLTTLK